LYVRESPMMRARALGLYEQTKVQALREYVEPGATFIDIGANKGDFTMLVASIVGPSGGVIAMNPTRTTSAGFVGASRRTPSLTPNATRSPWARITTRASYALRP
jgi:predicted methyltransferase